MESERRNFVALTVKNERDLRSKEVQFHYYWKSYVNTESIMKIKTDYSMSQNIALGTISYILDEDKIVIRTPNDWRYLEVNTY